MSNFETLKKELTDKAKKEGASCSEYRRALNSKTEPELLQVIFDNIQWCTSHKILDWEYLNKFQPENLKESELLNTGKENPGFINSGDSNSGNRNSGNRNSGDSNSGNWNSGNWNSGDSNSGYRNSGYGNSGNWNSGDRNSGDRNSGDRNSGNSNSGYRNSGNSNSGYRNSGNWNSGNRNSGDSNSGYRNSGAFCTDSDPIMILFNKPCKTMTVKQWEHTKAVSLMNSIDPTMWVPWSSMTEQERKDNPKYEASEGFCRPIPMKDAWKNTWGNWSDENKKVFTDLEHFDAKLFEEITGINVNK